MWQVQNISWLSSVLNIIQTHSCGTVELYVQLLFKRFQHTFIMNQYISRVIYHVWWNPSQISRRQRDSILNENWPNPSACHFPVLVNVTSRYPSLSFHSCNHCTAPPVSLMKELHNGTSKLGAPLKIYENEDPPCLTAFSAGSQHPRVCRQLYFRASARSFEKDKKVIQSLLLIGLPSWLAFFS